MQLPDNTVMDAPTNFAIVCKLTPGVKQDIKIWAYSEAGEGPKASATITTQIISKLVWQITCGFHLLNPLCACPHIKL